MTMSSIGGRVRLLSYMAGSTLRHVASRIETGPIARWRWPGPVPERLLIAPQDIRTADPTLASEIYSGYFSFSGQVVETGGQSPFDIRPPSPNWARQLHSFEWLRHLRAADSALTRQNARALINDWMAQEAKAPKLAFEPEVAARRVLAWITQSPLILEDADRTFYRRLLKSLVRQVRRIRARFHDAPEGYPRLISAIAVTEAALALEGQQRLLRQANLRLEQELNSQVLPDGGHVSRNPGLILDILTDLLPLRQAYTARNIPAPQALNGAIDRMMPMLRFYRHTDGAFAHFNGMAATRQDQLATVLAYDDARGKPVLNASHSGFQRLIGGGTVVLADVGRPASIGYTRQAHAGFLSFEMSSGGHRFIINCGSTDDERWQQAARSTPAHSTLSIENQSAARFISSGAMLRRLGPLMVGGPGPIPVRRDDRPDGSLFIARQNGYKGDFGVEHERSLMLSTEGDRIFGIDRLIGKAKSVKRDHFAIRFHLHPLIKASRTEGGEILLLAPDGEAWSFASEMMEPHLDEGVYLNDVHGRRRSLQIVIDGRISVTPDVTWSLTRTALGTRSRRERGPVADGGADLFK